ncbi:Sulfotransferase domain-containing protein [Cynara cardunculus var. scolymus]|uniref:Sulfotransferase n=2 Tax=Cynara cardunculus var. scolymus TaxID=59895 RepID=A0A103XB01_CYNCS|nr:Sulfotransferase domain-containing protein [Cynara cardunculus var. scolymus]
MSISASNVPSLSSVTKYIDEDEHEKTKMALIFDKYNHRLATLPKERGWITENLYMYQGFWHQSKRRMSFETVMALQDTFNACPTDIYLATLPKSGTTWLKAIVFAIVNRNRYKNDSFPTHPLLISNPHNCLPFVETEIFRNTPTYVNDPHSPRLFATHIPYTSLPRSILDSGCRLVYLCRNPKDVLVSMFHFANKLRDKSRGPMRFEEAFELFSKGAMPIGPYWDHVKSYHNVSLKHPTKILFLKYDDMKVDTVNHVKRLSTFLGYPFTEAENDDGAVQEIVRMCSFENLREVNKHGDLREGIPNDAFFREGTVGDWTNHLTSEMSEILDQITNEKFHGLDILF